MIRLHTSIWRMFFFGAHLLYSLKIRQGFHFLDPKIFKIKKISAHYWGLVLQHRQTKPGRKTNVEISISFVFCFSLVKKHFFFCKSKKLINQEKKIFTQSLMGFTLFPFIYFYHHPPHSLYLSLTI